MTRVNYARDLTDTPCQNRGALRETPSLRMGLCMPKAKRNHVSAQGALTQVAEYIVDCENGEYKSYVSHCEENELDPKDIRGIGQSSHVYALALIALGMEFPLDDEKEDACHE